MIGFKKPEMEIVLFGINDVIVTSMPENAGVAGN